ncbi:MAG: hypothetical protein AMJ54_04510 [Deltaproteobacteria bacterium SG8_13]|nr:MAG: hypothetical protein AMJ54_04510 [Deltaproteobacteria bacterium SG8_13]
MKRERAKYLGLTVIAAAVLLACAGTDLTTKRIDQSALIKPVSDILVIVVADSDETRRYFEGRFVEALKAAGVDAIASADAIPMPSDLELKKEAILQAVARHESDAVLVTHLADIAYTESRSRANPQEYGYYSYYGILYKYYHDPGYSRTYATVLLETNVFDVQTENLIWSGQTKSLDKAQVEIINDTISLVVRDLINKKLLAPK